MIQSLHLRNFKCFENQSVTFAPLTLLSGLNGMGKSSVLQALLLLRQSYHQGALPDTGLALNGDLVNIGTGKDALYEYAEDDAVSFNLQWTDGSASQWIFEYNPEADVLNLASEPVSSEIIVRPLFADDFQYLHAERLGPRVFSEKSDFQVRQKRRLGTRGQYAVDFLATFGRQIKSLEGTAHPKAVSAELFDQTEAWLGEITPGTRLRLVEHPDRDLISLRYAFLTGREAGSDYGATNTGFGLSYTLPVLVAVLSAKPGALLLFENPESHLHPKGQAKMGELMARAASCGIQIVVETHSDHVLNGIRVAVRKGLLPPDSVCLHFFERRADIAHSEIISPIMDRNGRIDRWPDGFFDEWDKSLEALLMPMED
ncbi:DUF3696 domain-containing protein [Desulfobacterales bacterium HSG2]|nr:DUF3696 domain-containing protein [Desulfobacterales bacterium HSG2]